MNIRPLIITFLKRLGLLDSFFSNAYPKTEYYVAAFEQNFKDAWECTPFGSDVSLRDLSYYRSLTCFYNENEEDYVDRRALFYTYLKNEYNTLNKEQTLEDPLKTLNRYKQTLPIDSNVKQIMRRITKLYDERPAREFTTKNDALQTDLTQLYNEMQFDSFIKNVYQLTKYVGWVAVRQRWIEDKPIMLVKTPDQFRIKKDPLDDTKIIEFWEVAIFEQKFAFRVWTEKERWFAVPEKHIVKANSFKIKNVENNSYGRIPYVFLWLHGGRLDLNENQLKLNRTQWQADLNASYNANPIKMGVNLEQAKITGAVDEMILVKDIIQPREGDPALPYIEYFQPETAYTELMLAHDNRLARIQRQEGIPNSIIEGDKSPPSGISRLLEMNELIERKREDEPILIEFEKNIADLVIIISNIDASKGFGDIDFNITYSTEPIVIEPEAEYDFDKRKMNDLTLDTNEFYIKNGGISNDSTFKETKEILEKRAIFRDEIKGLLPSSTKEEFNTPIQDEIENQLENIEVT